MKKTLIGLFALLFSLSTTMNAQSPAAATSQAKKVKTEVKEVKTKKNEAKTALTDKTNETKKRS